jgi:cell division protein FtsL
LGLLATSKTRNKQIMKTLKYIEPWLVVILLSCLMVDMTIQHLALTRNTQVLQQQVDSLKQETDSLMEAVKTREQINNTLIQTIK